MNNDPVSPGDAMAAKPSYAVFISYRHVDNSQEGRRWASWLHYGLETYEIPEDLIGTRNARGETIPPQLYPVFRDEEELPADADLSAAIIRALEASRYLLVICSPGAVDSRYVADEILEFKRMAKGENIIAAVVAGEPNVAEQSGQDESGDVAAECFPAPLRFELDADGRLSKKPANPLAADFRLPDGTQGWTSPEGYRQSLQEHGVSPDDVPALVEMYAKRLETMKLKVIAGILGVPLGVLTERDKAYRLLKERQRSRNLRRWLAVVLVLACLAVAGGGFALVKQREAERRQAEVVAALAASDFQQGTRALASADTTPGGLALLARAARDGGHQGASSRLWTLMQQRAFWLPAPGDGAQPAPPAPAVEIPADVRRRFAEVVMEGEVRATNSLAMSRDGRRVAAAAGHGSLDGVTGARVWSIDGTPLTPWFVPEYSGDFYIWTLDVHLSDDGRFIAVVASPNREPEYVELREVDTLQRWGDHIHATGKGPHRQHAPLSSVQVLPQFREDEVRLLTASGKGDASVHVFNHEWSGLVAQNRHRSAVRIALTDAEQHWLMSASADGEILVSSLEHGGTVGSRIVLEDPPVQLWRSGASGLAAKSASGERTYFTLHPPTTRDLPNHTADLWPRAACVDWRVPDNLPSNGIVLGHRESGLQLLYLGSRALGINPRASQREPLVRRFNEDLSLVCLAHSATAILTTTTGFVTEAWTSNDLQPIGQPLREWRFFGPGQTPEETRHVTLSPDGRFVLTHSFLWEPPNLANHWFTLWDLDSGLELMDRVHVAEDGTEDDYLDRAGFDSSGKFLLLMGRDGHALASLQIQPPIAAAQWLPTLAEAIGGVAYDRKGKLQSVDARQDDLAELLPRLQQASAAPASQDQ